MPCKGGSVLDALTGCGRTVSGETIRISLDGSTTDVGGNVAEYDVVAEVRRYNSSYSQLVTTKSGWVSGNSSFVRTIYGVHNYSNAKLQVAFKIYHRNTRTLVETIVTGGWTH